MKKKTKIMTNHDKYVDKFTALVRNLNYSQIKLVEFNFLKLKQWTEINKPKLFNEIKELEHDLDSEYTWQAIFYVNCVLKMYDKLIFLYITPSWIDWLSSNRTLYVLDHFRNSFKVDCQCTLLINPTIFLQAEDLDILYNSLNFKSNYSHLDLSYYDDNEDIVEDKQEKWGWLSSIEFN